MTKEENIAAYGAMADDDPTVLADLYIDFHDFSQIEFLIFKDRLSSAVLISKSAKRGIDALMSKFEAQRKDGSYLVPGWEAESGDVFSQTVGVTEDAYRLMIGATILTAVAGAGKPADRPGARLGAENSGSASAAPGFSAPVPGVGVPCGDHHRDGATRRQAPQYVRALLDWLLLGN